MQEKKHFLTIYFFVFILIMFFFNVSDGVTKLNSLECFRDYAVNMWGGMKILQGKDEAYGASEDKDVYRLANGYSVVKDINPNMEVFGAGVSSASELAIHNDAYYLFVAAPEKQLEKDVPAGILDFAEMKYDQGIAWLNNTGISYIDMKRVIEGTEEDWYSFFYRSDHHWNNKAALICVEQILKQLSSNGVVLKEYDSVELQPTVYPESHLGSSGRFSGVYFGGVDDYMMIEPVKSPKYIQRRYIGDGEWEEKNGDFSSCVLSSSLITTYNFDYYAYYNYLETDRDYTELINLENSDCANIVIIKDSFGIPVSALLSLYCHEVDIIDLRYVTELSAVDYINEKNPDVIISLFGPGNFGNESAMLLR